MVIPNCVDDFRETLLFAPLVIIAEVVLCLVLSWNYLALFVCVACDILLLLICHQSDCKHFPGGPAKEVSDGSWGLEPSITWCWEGTGPL